MKEKDFSSKNNKKSAGNWEVRDSDRHEHENSETDAAPEKNYQELDGQQPRKKRERIDFGKNRDFSDRPRRSFSSTNKSRNSWRDAGDDDFRKKRPYNGDENNDFRKKRPYNGDENSDFRKKQRYDRADKPRRTYSDADEQRPRDRFANDRRDNRFEKSRDRFEKPRRRYSDSDDSRDEQRYSGRDRFSTGRRDDRFDKPRKPFGKPEKHRHEPRKIDPDGLVRLNKFIANSGVCSRREADEYITAGLITVNDVVITELGTKIKQSDDVRFNGERLKGEKKVYVLLNKPKNYVTTVDDPHAKQTVMDLVEKACSERIYPVGRLDKNSTGVLLFTNDGELTKQLTHPSYNKMKIYKIQIDKNITKRDLQLLRDGVELEDGISIVDDIQILEDDKSELGIEIHSGKNRIIRRMFEHLGYEVLRLDRVYFAGLTKKGLERGEFRLLSPREVEILKMGAYD
ncbi:MAG: pseudouridine synthase [Prevotellaceae bacterium]|jgi:23S rRNA pseudouridine2605 synthase|nr:pseudouridine synthase [Prevotellaceae bacterium]